MKFLELATSLLIFLKMSDEVTGRATNYTLTYFFLRLRYAFCEAEIYFLNAANMVELEASVMLIVATVDTSFCYLM